MSEKPMMEKTQIDDDDLVKIAIYLEGVKAGKGNILPLGLADLENLWNAVKYIRGDARYEAKRDKK